MAIRPEDVLRCPDDKLLRLQEKLRAVFVRKRDELSLVDWTYRDMEAVEAELSRRRIFW